MSTVLSLQAMPIEGASPDLMPVSSYSVIVESCGMNSAVSLYCG